MALPLPPVQLKNNFSGWFLALWNYLFGLVKAIASQQPPVYRATITSLAAFAGTLTGTLTASVAAAIGAQDGVTLVAGNRVFMPVTIAIANGGAAADSGPYLVVNPGSSAGPGIKWVLTRPPEFAQGSIIPEGITFKVGSEGTFWSGNEWRSFPATGALLVGTGDPVFFPRTFQAQETIINPAATVVVTNFWIRSADSVSLVDLSSVTLYFISGVTPGPGTGGFTIHCATAGTENFAALAVNY